MKKWFLQNGLGAALMGLTILWVAMLAVPASADITEEQAITIANEVCEKLGWPRDENPAVKLAPRTRLRVEKLEVDSPNRWIVLVDPHTGEVTGVFTQKEFETALSPGPVTTKEQAIELAIKYLELVGGLPANTCLNRARLHSPHAYGVSDRVVYEYEWSVNWARTSHGFPHKSDGLFVQIDPDTGRLKSIGKRKWVTPEPVEVLRPISREEAVEIAQNHLRSRNRYFGPLERAERKVVQPNYKWTDRFSGIPTRLEAPSAHVWEVKFQGPMIEGAQLSGPIVWVGAGTGEILGGEGYAPLASSRIEPATVTPRWQSLVQFWGQTGLMDKLLCGILVVCLGILGVLKLRRKALRSS